MVAGLLAGITTSHLSAEGRVHYRQAVEELARWVESLRMAALAEHVGPGAGPEQPPLRSGLVRRGRVADVACVAAALMHPQRFGEALHRLRQGRVSRLHLRIPEPEPVLAWAGQAATLKVT